jgi:hypothetical protein
MTKEIQMTKDEQERQRIMHCCHSDPAGAGEESLIICSGGRKKKIRGVSLRST